MESEISYLYNIVHRLLLNTYCVNNYYINYMNANCYGRRRLNVNINRH